MNIMPFLKKFGVNPVNGQKITAKDLTKLTFHKNAKGRYHCPVTFKIFNENAHIVAVKPTGNVFSYEAIERLNIKPAFWKDLITDEPFTRKELITIQDPTDLDKFNVATFYHIKKNLKVLDEDEEIAKKSSRYHLKSVNAEMAHILNELDSTYKAPEKAADEKHKADTLNAAHYSTGSVAASFTSTAMVPETHQQAAIIDEDILRYERVKKKTYVRLVTNLGPINIELHSDMVPRTCENFLKHSQGGYYNGTIFHRSIKNFMIQGGDPTGTGTGGESIWGSTFNDELKPNLTHTGRGILSMANSGPNTNKSQFFFTYRSARHLDGKHSVFGRVVGGFETIDKMEKVETDAKDKPKDEIVLVKCDIFVDPYEEVDEQMKKDREEAETKAREEKEAMKLSAYPKKTAVVPKTKVFKQGVGKYINPATQKRAFQDREETVEKKRAKGRTGFDFTGW